MTTDQHRWRTVQDFPEIRLHGDVEPIIFIDHNDMRGGGRTCSRDPTAQFGATTGPRTRLNVLLRGDSPSW